MGNTPYETILREAQQLSEDERRRLREELALPHGRVEISTTFLSLPPVGAFAAALRMSEPIRPEILDAMERAIEEDFEGIDDE